MVRFDGSFVAHTGYMTWSKSRAESDKWEEKQNKQRMEWRADDDKWPTSGRKGKV